MKFEVILAKDAVEYLDEMPNNHRAKAEAIMRRLSELGPMLHRPHADAVRGRIRELRCTMGNLAHRFLFFFDHEKIIVTHGFLKKNDAVPEREIVRAERFNRAYLAEKS